MCEREFSDVCKKYVNDSLNNSQKSHIYTVSYIFIENVKVDWICKIGP